MSTPTSKAELQAIYLIDLHEDFGRYRLAYERRRANNPTLKGWHDMLLDYTSAFIDAGYPRPNMLLDFYTHLHKLWLDIGNMDALKKALVQHGIATWSEIDRNLDETRARNIQEAPLYLLATANRRPGMYLESTLAVYVDIPLDLMLTHCDAQTKEDLHTEVREGHFSWNSDLRLRLRNRLCGVLRAHIRLAGFEWEEIIAFETDAKVNPAVWCFFVEDTPANREKLGAQGKAVFFEPVPALYIGEAVHENFCFDELGMCSRPDWVRMHYQKTLQEADAEGQVLAHFRRKKLHLLINE